jgi:hypothetical protein
MKRSHIVDSIEGRKSTRSTRELFYGFCFAMVLIVVAIGVGGCGSSGSSTTGGGSNTPKTPIITGVSPTAGTPGTSLTITGSAFGATQAAGNGTVTFSTTTAPVVTWSDTSILVDVPSGLAPGMFR